MSNAWVKSSAVSHFRRILTMKITTAFVLLIQTVQCLASDGTVFQLLILIVYTVYSFSVYKLTNVQKIFLDIVTGQYRGFIIIFLCIYILQTLDGCLLIKYILCMHACMYKKMLKLLCK